jgi:hypothetical protein
MSWPRASLLALLISFPLVAANGQNGDLNLPKDVVAGAAFSIPTAGSGKAVLYIFGPAQVLKRDAQLGQPVEFAAGDLDHAGHYVAVLSSGSSTQTGEFDVAPASQPASLSFLARPSRIPADLQNGITAAVYIFDAYQNLITTPTPVSFQLSVASAPAQTRTVVSSQGAASTEMNSATKEGNAKFVAQVPGNPCGLKMNARQVGDKLDLETDPLRDCNGNAVTDGTVVTFTESWNGLQTTVDVPLKHGIAEAEVPAHIGARISVATGVVMGNEIRWEGHE